MRPKKTNIPIIKQANEELKQATFLVLSPDEVDLHGDVYDANEVRKACHNFNTYCRKANLLHLFDTDTFSVVESYIAPVGMQIGEQVCFTAVGVEVVTSLTNFISVIYITM